MIFVLLLSLSGNLGFEHQLLSSIIRSNWYEISKYVDDDILPSDVRSILVKRMQENFSIETHIIYELLEIVNGSKTLVNFCEMDIQEMLYIMCTS